MKFMTNTTLMQYVGRLGTLASERSAGLRTRVRIVDARRSFGRTDVLVTPLDGDGESWVALARVELELGDNEPVKQ
jgi:hypothetical protein